MKHLVAIAALGCAVLGAAQSPASAPKAASDGLFDSLLLTANSGARSLDVYSTTQMLNHGGHEMFLPDWLSHNPSLLSAYSSSAVATEQLVYLRLKQHHSKLARTLYVLDIGSTTFFAIRNLTLEGAHKNELYRNIRLTGN